MGSENTPTVDDSFMTEVKEMILDCLELDGVTPETLDADTPLFSEEGLGLDSIDAMELGVAVKRRYNVTVSAETEEVDKHFSTVRNIAAFIHANRPR